MKQVSHGVPESKSIRAAAKAEKNCFSGNKIISFINTKEVKNEAGIFKFFLGSQGYLQATKKAWPVTRCEKLFLNFFWVYI